MVTAVRLFDEGLRAAGWHSRGYLPHFEGGEVVQFVTFRLKDSLPRSVVEMWRRELARGDDAALRRRAEAYLDEGYGAASLKEPRVASVVQNALLYYDGARYHLAAWVVMPNHVHFPATPCVGHTLSAIMHSLKSYTASEANRLLGLSGAFWMEDYFDRYIRNATHYERTINYIENNPVKAKLCRTADEWPFGSARLKRPRTS
jgi:REP element-mobilizing transposase RayT